ncbi:aryl hydrocarbon receptor-like [Pungitius pungitius]|uniref:aryl hydrocarbon receptor-like n=1 Tax=Pungitius pungitius TaxID=134920 RepID=UPI002E0DC036
MYAGRKRRKPVQRASETTLEERKSRPGWFWGRSSPLTPPLSISRRGEARPGRRGQVQPVQAAPGPAERRAGAAGRPAAVPEEVTAGLDKLSILRLSVSFLRAKNFFSVTLTGATPAAVSGDGDDASAAAEAQTPEGELLLQALNGFVMVLTASGTIFYSSHTIQDYLGFHQTDVMHQSVYELVHTEDQQELRRNLHWALNPPPAAAPAVTQDSPREMEAGGGSSVVTYSPEQLPPENSSFLERSFVCRFRCLLDNSSGFLALNVQGRLKFLHGQKNGGKAAPQLALFAIATPLQPPSILEIRTKNMIFRTKHQLDFTPLACDAKGKIVLGYTEAELRVRGSGYQFIHAADMLYCAENHVRMMKTGESGLTVFRLLTKENLWKWVQANARLVYKNGKPDYIIATQRPLLDEEGGEHLRKRSMHLPFTYATGEALLYQSNHPIAAFRDGGHEKNGTKSKKSRTERLVRHGLDPGSLLGALMSQDESVYVCQPAAEPKVTLHSFFGEQTVGFSEPEPAGAPRRWDEPSGGGFDPLLSTLDGLSLEGLEVADGEEAGDLFGALEGLGLSAEDLELLLLDERMIRVEMDPERVPALDDLLTNDEILSYIYDSMEAEAGGAPPGSASPPESAAASSSGANVQMQFPHHKPPAAAHAPILQLSQQMQQHLNMRAWDQRGGHSASAAAANGHATGALVEHFRAAFSGEAPTPEGELHQTHQRYLQLQHLAQRRHADQKVAAAAAGPNGESQWRDYGRRADAGGGSCLENGAECGASGGGPFGGKVIRGPSQCPAPNATLEQILAAAAPEVPLGPAPHKVENGCLLNGAYPGGRALASRNGTAPPAAQMPETLSCLPDPPASSFYL